MIEFRQVTKQYKGKNGVKDLQFVLPAGSITALCGGNGAGKSTLIRLLIQDLLPQSGTIQSKIPTRTCGFMPDDLAFPETVTAWEVINHLANLQQVDKQKVEQVLRRVGLFEERNKKVRSYSKGMRQRLSFAQSLLSASPLLVLDEPTNGLDPYWVKKWKEEILLEKEKGRTIIFSSHVLSLVEEIADFVVFLHRGQQLVADSVQEIQKQAPTASLESYFFTKIESQINQKME